MSTLKITAYGLTHTKNERNADNYYHNNNRLVNAREPQYIFEQQYSANIQVFAVSDAGAKVKDRDIAARNGELVMSTISALQTDMEAQNAVEKKMIWSYLNNANDSVISRAHQNDTEMQVSFSGLFFQGNRVMAAHVGDTRIYCIRGNAITQLTKDDLTISMLYDRGVISQEKMELHKKTSQLSYYIGMEGLEEHRDAMFTKYYYFEPGDMFLLCTDGITDTFLKNDMEDLVKNMTGLNPASLLNLLAKRAEERSTDDYTMELLRVDEVGDSSQTAPASASFIQKVPSEPIPEPKEETKATEEQPASEEDLGDTKPVPELTEEPEETPDLGDTNPFVLKPAEMQDNTDFADSEDADPFSAEDFSKNLEKKSYESNEVDDENEDEDDESNDRVRKPFLIAGCVVLLVVLVILLCLILKLVGGDKKEQDSKSQSSKIESVIESESESIFESEPESEEESESESEIESEPVSEEESEPESRAEDKQYTTPKGAGWWTILNENYGSKYANDKYYIALKRYNGLDDDATTKSGQILLIPPLEVLQQYLPQ